MIRAAPLTHPPFKLAQKVQETVTCLFCHKYGLIHWGDSCEFYVNVFFIVFSFLWGDSWHGDSLMRFNFWYYVGFAESYWVYSNVNFTFDGQTMTSFCVFKDMVKTYPNQSDIKWWPKNQLLDILSINRTCHGPAVVLKHPADSAG